jgi:hypothetical protein
MTDPQGIAWETYHTLGEAEIYGVDRTKVSESRACCAPEPQAVSNAERKTEGTSCC